VSRPEQTWHELSLSQGGGGHVRHRIGKSKHSRQETERAAEPLVANMDTIALRALHVDDDTPLNPWTFRMFFLGTQLRRETNLSVLLVLHLGFGLSGFGSALATIFLFKPQSVSVFVIFLTAISYVIGNAMSLALPRSGFIGRWFNPHSFNSKEHLAIVITSSSASSAAAATEVLATQKLYYDIVPNAFVAILLLISSQLLGYGMAGVLRKSLVYPTKMWWPSVLPLSSLIETLNRDKSEMRKKFNIFWIIFGLVTVWELFLQYVMPVLTGVSFFCLANRESLVFTNIFGGTSGNEGLRLLAFSHYPRKQLCWICDLHRAVHCSILRKRVECNAVPFFEPGTLLSNLKFVGIRRLQPECHPQRRKRA
jgi:hypothetical protein